MPEHPKDELAFEHWVEWIFDRPVAKPEWYQDKNAELWVSSPAVTIAFITRLFETAPRLLQKYSGAQAAQGLWFLASSIFSDELSHLYGNGILRSDRHRCIESIYTLFELYFAVRCSLHLAYLNEAGANPLNEPCYMWWDFLAHKADGLEGRVGTDMDCEILSTMERILKLNHDACTESALHGLGHWQRLCPDQVVAIIDRFVAGNSTLRPELRDYAIKARAGRVL